MGYLLKEALKTLCGVNKWSYAVFWKIGYQNPNILVWEECYYDPNSYSTHQDSNASWAGKVSLLINKMIMDNQVNILGEGLVGRVAFTGNHQWVLSEIFCGEGHPPEVLNEVHQQFSAGMKTVAVVPVLPHGVVQFGSYLTIEENLNFIHDVMILVFQLREAPGVLLSDNYMSKEPARRFGVPVCHGSSSPVDSSLEYSTICAPSSFIADSLNHVESSVRTSVLDTQTSNSFTTEIRNDLLSTVGTFQSFNSSSSCMKPCDYNHTAMIAPSVKAEVKPSNSKVWINQYSPVNVPMSSLEFPSSPCLLNRGSISGYPGPFSSPCGIPLPTLRKPSILASCPIEGLSMPCNVEMLPKIDSDSCSNASRMVDESFTSKSSASIGINSVDLLKKEAVFSNCLDQWRTNSFLGSSSCIQYNHMDKMLVENDFYTSNEELNMTQARDISPSHHKEHRNTVTQPIFCLVEEDEKRKLEDQSHMVSDTNYDESVIQSQSGDDLFDICGADFKTKMFSSRWKSCKPPPNMHNSTMNIPSKKILASSDRYAGRQGNLDNGIFSSGPDHLLDAVVANVHSAVKPILDDDVSCRTTLTNATSSSRPNTGFLYSQFGVSNQMKGELLNVPKHTAEAGITSPFSLRNASSKEDSGTCSQISTIYGSQISSLIEKGHNVNNSVSTESSKKHVETIKPNRKRLKPGENPRPRPKDRQMIQDCFKELRQIVPNGAKCSMDALLERTIKHMVFLQNVTKHADKLKQTGDPKIIDKDGSLLLKYNFEGGATWAYEVDSQSMVCPLIVEDLDQPRQMLVEMLCEERGFFLEIADIIRGLGLTIVKGVMETRNGKIWSRFTVEANRDVTRMEIFLSLVHLLEQSSKSCIPPANSVSCDKTTVHQQIHHAASLPVTEISHNFH